MRSRGTAGGPHAVSSGGKGGFMHYGAFLARLLAEYEPFPYEIEEGRPSHGRGANESWAVRHSRRFHHTYEATVPYVRDGGTLLDVGAYPGSYLKILRLFHGTRFRLIAAGMPVRPRFPEDLRRWDIDFVPCDLDVARLTAYPRRLALPDESISTVVCTEMIEHLYGVQTLLSEIHRVLEPGGRLYLGTNNVAYLPGMVRLLYGETNLDVDLAQTSALADSEWRGHVRFFSLRQLAELGRRFGFAVVEQGYLQLRAPRQAVSAPARLRWRVARALDVLLTLAPIYRSHIFVSLRRL